MSFQSPLLLVGLLAVPILAGLYFANQQRRRAYVVRFTNLALLNQVMGKGPGFRRHLPAIIFLIGLSGLLLAMARPEAIVKIPKERASVVLAIDTSGSMAATDVQPTRIEAAIKAGRTLIDQLPSQDLVGLITFNHRATVLAAPTQDHGAVKEALGTIGPGGATAIGDAIQASVTLLASVADPNAAKQPPAMIVLLTDGSNNRGISPLDAAAQAKQAGIPVQAIGIGQKGQTTLSTGQTIDGVDEQTLQAIASTTGGHYFFAADENQLHDIYKALGSRIGFVTSKVDLTVPLMAAGTMILVLGGLFSLRWFRLLP